MAKYFGMVGYAVMQETAPDVYEDAIEEREYFGDVTRNIRKWQNGQSLNDDLDIDNVISIVADPYALQHLTDIRYVVWNDVKWKVKSVEVQYPRLTLSIGGVYNENQS